MHVDILFEDQDLLVINKPAGVVVNQATTTETMTIQKWFHDRENEGLQADNWQSLIPADFDDTYGSPEEIFGERQGIVHRLDKDTSGVLILAKNPGALVNLLAQFKQRHVQKRYTCLVHGKFRVPEGMISAPIERATFDRHQFVVTATGRPAETQYQVQQQYKAFDGQQLAAMFDQLPTELSLREFVKRSTLYQGFSLVYCWPKTGRTHQIRVHLKHWKHPIVGDSRYVGKKRAALDRIWVPRQFLHASELSFTHPRTGESMHSEAPLSPDLEKSLSLLEKN